MGYPNNLVASWLMKFHSLSSRTNMVTQSGAIQFILKELDYDGMTGAI